MKIIYASIAALFITLSSTSQADCSRACQPEMDKVYNTKQSCRNKYPGYQNDIAACINEEADPYMQAHQTCVRICNTQGESAVRQARQSGQIPQPY